jgi:dihydrodipicolinate synthase/N-acetylneuraminate lyase
MDRLRWPGPRSALDVQFEPIPHDPSGRRTDHRSGDRPVTPLRDGAIDEAGLIRLVETQLAAGIGGLLVGAQAVGEGATLALEEVLRAAKLCSDVAGSSAAVIVDVSSNGTAKAAARARQAEAAGAGYLLVCAPWYNRPGQDGIVQHFEAVAANCGLPILAGADASRSCAGIGAEALVQIAALETVTGLVEWSPDVSRITTARRQCPVGFSIPGGRRSHRTWRPGAWRPRPGFSHRQRAAGGDGGLLRRLGQERPRRRTSTAC